MSTSQNVPVKPQRRFQFIDNSNVSTTGHNSTQVRRHVMQEYMREKRWEARSQSETALFEQEPQRHACRLPEVEVRRRNTRRRKEDDSKRAKESPTTNHPTPASKKTVIMRLKKDSVHSSETRSWTTTNGDISNPTRYHPSFWRRSEARSKVSKRGFFLDAGSFARLADVLPDTVRAHSLSSSLPHDRPQSLQACKKSKCLQDAISKCISPVTPLSAARTDPFDALPMKLNTESQELFDFYARVMPSYSTGFERRHPQAQRWYHNVLIPEAMKSAVTFQNTVLQHAAITQASVMGLQETELASRHRARAAEMLEQHQREFPEDVSDGVISATISAAALADLHPCLEQRRSAWDHWAAVVHQIRQRGGPAALEQKSSLCKLINWQDYVLSGYDGRDSLFYLTPESALSPQKERKVEMDGRQEIGRQCEEFLVFLRCVDQLASVVALQSENPLARQYQPFRYTIFVHDQPLYKLLGNESRLQRTSANPLQHTICRLASLITINLAIWEHRYDTKQSEAFFAELVENIMYNQLDKSESAEVLLQILLYNSDSPASGRTERPWLVGRLLKIGKRLSRSSWEWLNDFLWSNLALTDRRGGQLEYWEKRFRKEILEAPLYKHSLRMLNV